MNCLKPIMLKSGQLVPCGKCELCQSQIRTEKSVLVQLHCEYQDRMPLFIGFSYDPEHVPMTEKGVPTLHRPHVSAFIKNYKRLCGLDNAKFQYFGCGEYGDTYQRPHYHLIWFGDSNLEKLYDSSVQSSERWLAEFWQLGHVDINVAEWSGIHYVTKYCLKDDLRYPDGAVPPFTITSNGLGMQWLKSPQAEKIRQQLLYIQFNKEKIYEKIDLSSLDWSDHRHRIEQLAEFIEVLRPVMPNFEVRLPSGKTVFLPRKLRRKLVGSYQHFKDSPIWIYTMLQEWYETDKYLLDNKEYDDSHEKTVSLQQREQHALSISQRIKRNRKSL